VCGCTLTTNCPAELGAAPDRGRMTGLRDSLSLQPPRQVNFVGRLGETMVSPPPVLNGARVLTYAIIGADVTPTGNTVHRFHPDGVMGPAAALAICQYEGEKGCYLFYCDTEWNVVTDTWHESLGEAMKQAEFEYSGISFV
jgi:hypothetical protein